MIPWRFLVQHAWREVRAMGRRQAIFVACLAVGVAAVASVTGLSRAVTASLRDQARELLAADLVVRGHRPTPPAVLEAIAALPGARSSTMVQMITMAAGTAPAVGGVGRSALVDPEEMSMVLRNLLENAVLYSPQSPDISVKLFKTETTLHLSVQDQGRGLDRKELKKVFERFYRAQPPGGNVRGTGLGLYIVESVIKGYGGTVGVTSAGSGKGCMFMVKIPAA